jgi:hypothetical protein
MNSFIITMSRTIFFRLLAHAPEELQREVKENALGAIPALCFTEDDIRKKFAQEEQWDGLTQDLQREAIRLLMDADEYCYLNDNFAGLARLSFLSGLTALSFLSSNSNP